MERGGEGNTEERRRRKNGRALKFYVMVSLQVLNDTKGKGAIIARRPFHGPKTTQSPKVQSEMRGALCKMITK